MKTRRVRERKGRVKDDDVMIKITALLDDGLLSLQIRH